MGRVRVRVSGRVRDKVRFRLRIRVPLLPNPCNPTLEPALGLVLGLV